jgi:hypothetical protein
VILSGTELLRGPLSRTREKRTRRTGKNGKAAAQSEDFRHHAYGFPWRTLHRNRDRRTRIGPISNRRENKLQQSALLTYIPPTSDPKCPRIRSCVPPTPFSNAGELIKED